MGRIISIRTMYFFAALAVAVLSGVYWLIKVGQECKGVPLMACATQAAKQVLGITAEQYQERGERPRLGAPETQSKRADAERHEREEIELARRRAERQQRERIEAERRRGEAERQERDRIEAERRRIEAERQEREEWERRMRAQTPSAREFSPYARPSFDCAVYGRTPLSHASRIPQSEILCLDSNAADADREMGDAFYRRFSALTGNARQNLRDSQKQWIIWRNSQCPTNWGDVHDDGRVRQIGACLAEVTRRRASELRQ